MNPVLPQIAIWEDSRDLFRAMTDDDGRPMVGDHDLGVRAAAPGINDGVVDVHPDDDGQIQPGEGMSVAPDDPMNLPMHRRSRELGGTGKKPVWVVASVTLQGGLTFRQDTSTHGSIEPRAIMQLAAFREEVAGTQPNWRLHA